MKSKIIEELGEIKKIITSQHVVKEMLLVGKDDLKLAISEAVGTAMGALSPTKSKTQPFIKGIHELAKFLKVSPTRAQKLKNENAFPYWQDGRTLLFDPDKVKAAMDGCLEKRKHVCNTKF
jgi:hypothetical protein